MKCHKRILKIRWCDDIISVKITRRTLLNLIVKRMQQSVQACGLMRTHLPIRHREVNSWDNLLIAPRGTLWAFLEGRGWNQTRSDNDLPSADPSRSSRDDATVPTDYAITFVNYVCPIGSLICS